MDDFLNKVKEGATKVFSEAEKFTNAAVNKTKTVVDKTKYNYTISGIETKIHEILKELGAKIYGEYKNGAEFDADILENCAQIDSLKQEIADIRAKIAEIDSAAICKSCGEIVSEGSLYCSKCGEKIDN